MPDESEMARDGYLVWFEEAKKAHAEAAEWKVKIQTLRDALGDFAVSTVACSYCRRTSTGFVICRRHVVALENFADAIRRFLGLEMGRSTVRPAHSCKYVPDLHCDYPHDICKLGHVTSAEIEHDDHDDGCLG